MTRKRRLPSHGPEQLREMAESWARKIWDSGSEPPAYVPGLRAVVVQTDRREDDFSPRGEKRYRELQLATRTALAEAMRQVEAGDLAAAEAAVRAAGEAGWGPAYWCSEVSRLAEVLCECLSHGETCYETGPVRGPAGEVIWMSVWYDPSHPV